MRRTIVLLLVATILVLASLPDAAAAPAPTWRRSFGDRLSSVATDDAGRAYVVGSKEVRVGWALVVARYGPGGSRKWQRSWHPSQSWVWGQDIAVAPDGSVYVVGGVNATHTEGGAWFIRKYSAGGRLLWDRKSPGWRTDLSLAEEMTAVAAGRRFVVVAGNHYGCCSMAADDGWIRAYSHDGRLLWTRQFEVPGVATATNDRVNDVAVGGLDRIYVGGHVEMQARDDTSERVDHEIVLQKLSPSGSVVWTRMLRDRGVRDYETIVDVGVRGNAVMVTGTRNTSRAWLARLTVAGALSWSRVWGRDTAQPSAVAPAGSGSLVVGTAHDPQDDGSDAFVRRYSPHGRLRWELRLEGGHHVDGTGIAVGSSGTYVTGYRWYPHRDESAGWLWRFAD